MLALFSSQLSFRDLPKLALLSFAVVEAPAAIGDVETGCALFSASF